MRLRKALKVLKISLKLKMIRNLRNKSNKVKLGKETPTII